MNLKTSDNWNAVAMQVGYVISPTEWTNPALVVVTEALVCIISGCQDWGSGTWKAVNSGKRRR